LALRVKFYNFDAIMETKPSERGRSARIAKPVKPSVGFTDRVLVQFSICQPVCRKRMRASEVVNFFDFDLVIEKGKRSKAVGIFEAVCT
jgi:hypothetical protein